MLKISRKELEQRPSREDVAEIVNLLMSDELIEALESKGQPDAAEKRVLKLMARTLSHNLESSDYQIIATILNYVLNSGQSDNALNPERRGKVGRKQIPADNLFYVYFDVQQLVKDKVSLTSAFVTVAKRRAFSEKTIERMYYKAKTLLKIARKET